MSDALPSPWLLRLRAAGLGVAVVGVQLNEAVATVGLVLVALGTLPDVRRIAWRPWAPLLAFVAWALLAPPLAGRPPSGSGLARTVDWLFVPLVAHALGQASRRTVWALGVTLGLSCLAAGLQHFGAWPAEEAFSSLRWLKANFVRVYEPVPGAEGRFMAGGLLFHRLKFAHVSSLTVLALTALGFRAAGRDRALLWGAAGVGFLSIWLFPYARMAAAAATAALALAVVLGSGNRRRALLASAVVLALGGLSVGLVAPLRARFESALTAQGNGDRAELLATGLRAVSDHPWVGLGPGQFRPAKYATAATPVYVKENPGKAHNQLVSMAAETGVPGAVLFAVLLLSLAWRARQGPGGDLAFSALAFFAVLSTAHDPLFQAPFSMALVLTLGAAASSSFPARRPTAG